MPFPNELFSPAQSEKDQKNIKMYLENFFKKKIEERPSDFYINGNKTSVITDFIRLIPLLLEKYRIRLRRYNKYCRSCIISYGEVLEMAEIFYDQQARSCLSTNQEPESEKRLFLRPFQEQKKNIVRVFTEWIYTFPIAFQELGFELYRPAEDVFINENLAENLAKSIEARYRKHMMENHPAEAYKRLYFVLDQSDSEEPRLANIDNAFHIPSKLLSIGYKIEKIEEGLVPPLLKLSEHEIEVMSMIEHDRWVWQKRLEGYSYHGTRNDELKRHNCLVPFEDLPEYEKEKDRIMVRFIPALLLDTGYRAIKVNPSLQEEINYINQQEGFVFEVKTQLNRLKSEVEQEQHKLQETIASMKGMANDPHKLKATMEELYSSSQKGFFENTYKRLNQSHSYLNHIKNTFRGGRSIQRTFMPASYELKEAFPDSFILYKPKDIVSGDFYFISRQAEEVFFTAADCTGHGISGSILSGICYNYLHEAICTEKISKPLAVLNYVMPKVRNLLKHSGSNISSGAEMELGLCRLNLKTNVLKVASYGRPVYCFKDKELTILGKGSKLESLMQNGDLFSQEIQLVPGDTIYSFSDGYADQIGGPKNKKYMSRRLKDFLGKIQSFSMEEQSDKLNIECEDWRKCKGQYSSGEQGIVEEQTDDISFIGIRV